MRVVRNVAYLTDIEGRWDKLESFCARSPDVALDPSGRLVVSEGSVFVFGGDAIDRGPHARRVVSTLLAAKRAQPDRVVLLAGNRDINKLRLVRELRGHPPRRAPAELASAGPGALLSFIFTFTMGARDALAHRQAELESVGEPSSPDDAAQSFLEDLEPRGELSELLALSQLAHREGTTLFVHGGVTPENLGAVPLHRERTLDVDRWVERLNSFYAESLHGFVTRRMSPGGAPSWATLIDYQAPLDGTRLNQASVVYARTASARGEPRLPDPSVVADLLRAGVERVVVGHTPVGDCPAVLRDPRGFELVMADNSYGRLELGPRVTVTAEGLTVDGETELDGGERATVRFTLARGEGGPLGLVDADTGSLVKARLEAGDFLLYRPLDGYRVEQVARSAEELAGRRLLPPHEGSFVGP